MGGKSPLCTMTSACANKDPTPMQLACFQNDLLATFLAGKGFMLVMTLMTCDLEVRCQTFQKQKCHPAGANPSSL